METQVLRADSPIGMLLFFTLGAMALVFAFVVFRLAALWRARKRGGPDFGTLERLADAAEAARRARESGESAAGEKPKA